MSLLAGAILRTPSTFPSKSAAAAWTWATSVSPVTSRMKSTGVGQDGSPSPKIDPASNPKVLRLRDLVAADPRGAWDECWKEELTPWDLGQPTPVILDLMQADSLPKGRVLVPGCGTGYDVVAIAGPERYVVGLDISENAVKKSEALFSSLWNAKYFTFVAADFFAWCPSQLFDLIYDYTFFCAIDPSMRSAWAHQIQNLLVPDGELLTLIYPNDNFAGGPPFAVSLSAYEDVLGPVGFVAVSVEDNVLAIGPRKGRELIARWKRSSSQSSL